jgi:hypothetical protein
MSVTIIKKGIVPAKRPPGATKIRRTNRYSAIHVAEYVTNI